MLLAATDPANPYGALLPWLKPETTGESKRCARTAGAKVILFRGELIGFISKSGDQLTTFLCAR